MRYVAPWDALMTKWQRDETDAYMAAARERRRARAARLRALARRRSAAASRCPRRRCFRREFLRFRERYPFVTNYLTWNEANHCSQPTCRKPGRAARFYDILRKNCRRCTVSAPALLDKLDMPQWVRAFERKAKYRVKVWSLHNYIDANRFRTRGTRSLLRATKAKIWFTETGGLVRRDNGSRIEFADSPRHAVKATRWVIRLARLSPRVRRVYFYHWVAPAAAVHVGLRADRPPRAARGPSYNVVRTYMRHSRAANRKLAASRRAKQSR